MPADCLAVVVDVTKASLVLCGLSTCWGRKVTWYWIRVGTCQVMHIGNNSALCHVGFAHPTHYFFPMSHQRWYGCYFISTHKPTIIMQAPICFNFLSIDALSFSHLCQILIDLLQVRLGCPIYISLSCCIYCMISFNLSITGHGGYLMCWKSVCHALHRLTDERVENVTKTSKNAKKNPIKLYDLSTELCTSWWSLNVN